MGRILETSIISLFDISIDANSDLRRVPDQVQDPDIMGFLGTNLESSLQQKEADMSDESDREQDDDEGTSMVPGEAEDVARAKQVLTKVNEWLVAGKEVFFSFPAKRQIAMTAGSEKSLCGGSEHLVGLVLDGLVKLAEQPDLSTRIVTVESGAKKRYCETVDFSVRKIARDRRQQ